MVSGGRVHWIDFGMIGEITEADITALENIVVGLLKSDTDLMADGVLSIGLNTGGCDRNKLKDNLELFCTKYKNVSSLSDIDFSGLLGEVCDLSEKHHIMMPGRFTMLVRSFLTIGRRDGAAVSGLGLFEVISGKLMDRLKKSFSLEKEIMNMGSGILDVGKKVSRIPADRGIRPDGGRVHADLCAEADLQEKEKVRIKRAAHFGGPPVFDLQ